MSWLTGEQTYNVLWATMEQYLRQGLISDSKVLDIRHVDVSATCRPCVSTDWRAGLDRENFRGQRDSRLGDHVFDAGNACF